MAKLGYRTIHAEQKQQLWDNSVEPVMRVEPGSTVTFEDIDAASGQIKPSSTEDDVRTMDLSLINPVSGPVYVEGAKPGDALKVVMREFASSGWAWTAIVPGFGLLAEDFPDPGLHIWRYEKNFRSAAAFGDMARVPLKPFCGTVGLAPAAPGQHSTIPPRRVGGNMDIRDVSLDVELYLPVEVEGALFSLGDTHAAQGDGEVCGTAIESPMSVTVELNVVKGGGGRTPRFATDRPVSRHLDAKGYDVTTGIEPDLMEAAKNAVRNMIEFLGKTRNMSAEDAYMLCSVCADMRISEIVDQPNWIVSCYLPRVVFD